MAEENSLLHIIDIVTLRCALFLKLGSHYPAILIK